MAQLDYFGTLNDSFAMLQEIFARGDVRAYWDAGPHDRPESKPFTSLTDELKDKLVRRPYLFL